MNYIRLIVLGSCFFCFQLGAKPKHYKKVETQSMYQEQGNAKFSMSSYSSKEVIKSAYKDISGHVIPDEERAAKKKQMLDDQEIVYGEIKHEAVTRLLQELKLTSQDVLYDFGSGVGKFCLQVALDSPAKKVVGIELCTTRHMNATKATTLVQDDIKISIENRLFFKEEDFLKSDIHDATVIYLCSLCYSDQLMLALTKKFSKLPLGLRVVTLKELPEYREGSKEFVLVKIIPKLAMTWDKKVDIYLYELQDTKKIKEKNISKKSEEKTKKSSSKESKNQKTKNQSIDLCIK